MLTDLRVRGLGVIEDLTLRVGPGMTALTGETGAGKTLVVEALQLVLGGRAAPGLVRSGAGEAVVEAAFAVDEGGTERQVVLSRTVPAAGRSRAEVDGRMVPVAALAEAGGDLVDICGQHDHQSLGRAGAPRRALDGFGGIDTGPLAAAAGALAEVDRQLQALGGDPQQRAREVDVLRFQVDEIDAAGIGDPGEEDVLRAEEGRLADAAAHREAAARARALLDAVVGAEGLGGAAEALRPQPAFSEWVARVRAAAADVADVASDLRRVEETWVDDPERLAAVQARRRLLADLRRKYGETLADVLAFADGARARLASLLGAEEEATRLAAVRAARVAEVAAAEARLRAARAAAAGPLGAQVERRLAELAMPGAVLSVSVAEQGAGEPVQFLLSANPGEPPQPLARVASGGELSRAMLALRLVTLGGAPTMVFDEVDAGVGGEAALALARALREVARTHQVLVVTHLAQVAAFADHQVAVEKTVRAGHAATVARPLEEGERVVELARMLSGHPGSEAAQAHATELLALARVGAR